MDTYNLEITSLARNNINLILPSFNKLIIDHETNVYNFQERLYDYIGVREYCTEGSITILDQINKSFDLLDSVLDNENAGMTGKSFTHKYNAINRDTEDHAIVFSQIYRILMVLRNAKVHESESIFFDGNNIFVDRKNKDIKLIIKKDILDYILSYAIYYTNVRNIEINECYKHNIALWYYSKIKPLIFEFIDSGNSIKLLDTKKDTILAGIDYRYICENVHFVIQNNNIKLCIKQKFLYSANQNNSLLDFVFDFGNKHFMVPYEIIKNGEIDISELQGYEFTNDKLRYLDNFYNGLMNKNNAI
jgi:hypothetical protein